MQTTRIQLSVQLSVLLATICAVFLLIGGAADAGEGPGPSIRYVVAQGDTLWDVAADHVGPDEDVRPLIQEIKELSGIQSSSLRPGQVLLIPRP
ncbi:MAG TPA: LysM peptidoglycan-binding domain-containing protein [Acidimicrobiia bacterium]|nr:LysM peptidoglycan-binding domain-containing protein [Acidimicrobiia bacterium]